MHPKLLQWLTCPHCGGAVEHAAPSGCSPGDQLACASCGAVFALSGGVVRFVPDDQYVGSFSHQWNRYEVQRPEEDEETFQLKTGVDTRELEGQRVLDAGCGGGRYAAVLGRCGADLIAADLSRAVEKAAQLCGSFPNVQVVQADLLHLPVRHASMDLVFSIGVLHHSPQPREAFHELALRVKPGGRLAVWLYRRNTFPQEAINTALRGVTTRLPMPVLEGLCRAAAFMGAVPVLNRTLNKVVNFSNHPSRELRVCDNFDWYSPRYQSHHRPGEIRRWFEEEGFESVTELPPAKTGRIYRWAYDHNLIIGSGVNFVGVKPGERPASAG